jgi:hypothetical protein
LVDGVYKAVTLKKQVEKKKTAITKVGDRYEIENWTKEQYAKKVGDINNTIKELEGKITQLEASLTNKDGLTELIKEMLNKPIPANFSKDFRSIDFSHTLSPISKDTLHTIIKEIVVHIDHVEVNLINENTFTIDRNLLKGRKRKKKILSDAIVKSLERVVFEGSINLPKQD